MYCGKEKVFYAWTKLKSGKFKNKRKKKIEVQEWGKMCTYIFTKQILSTYYMLDTTLDSKGSRIGKTHPICPCGAYIIMRKADNEQISQAVMTSALKKNKAGQRRGATRVPS